MFNTTPILHDGPYPIRHCGERTRELIFLIDEAIHTALVTYRDAEQERPSRAFTSMFKVTEKRDDVSWVLRSLLTWSTEGPLAHSEFICVTPDIRRLYPDLPIDIWAQCEATSFNVIRVPRSVNVYICPRFFNLPGEPYPGPGALYYCPFVVENRFADNPYGLQFPESANWVLLNTFLTIQHRFPPQPSPSSYLEALNGAVGADIYSSTESVYNFLFYLTRESILAQIVLGLNHERSTNASSVVKNTCREFPNIHIPPWNFPDMSPT